MMPALRPRFEIVVGTSSAAERRLVTPATVRALTGLPETGDGSVDDATLILWIDAVLAQCATYCRLARAGAAPRTLAQEVVRATWPASYVANGQWPRGWFLDDRGTQLLLPWRVPVTAIEMTEGETELEENVDFRLLGAGVVERLSGGAACCWATGGIVADYTAGWVLPSDDPSYEVDGETLPPDLVARIADQVKLAYDQRDVDRTLRSEDVVGVWSGSYNVPGGDAIATSGLTRPLEDALAPYRAPPTFA